MPTHEETIAGFDFYQWSPDPDRSAVPPTNNPDSFDIGRKGVYGDYDIDISVTKEEAIKMRDWIDRAIERMD
jgi:hypothetical protein